MKTTACMLWLMGGLLGTALPAQQDGGPVFEVRSVTGASAPEEAAPAGVPLSGAEAARIFQGTAPLPSPESHPFTLPPGQRPAPAPTVQVDLPLLQTPDQAPEGDDAAALTVRRFAPVGVLTSVHEAVTVTFSAPMVALTDLGSLPRIPVRLEPAVPGDWRWVSTDTLRFEHQDGLPAATAFEVTVPAGVRDAAGVALQEAVRWTFATPRPALVAVFPAEETELPDDPLIALAFNQAMDPGVVAAAVTLQAGTARAQGVVVPRSAPDFDTHVDALAMPADHVVLLRFSLRPGTRKPVLHIAAGLTGLQGDLPGEAVDTAFQARAPFSVKWAFYSYPEGGIYLNFNRALNATVDPSALVQIAPVPDGLRVRTSDDTLILDGDFRDLTTYDVSVSQALTDIYGEPLQEAYRNSFEITFFDGQNQRLPSVMALAESGARELVFVTNGCPSLSVQVYAVTDEDQAAFQAASYREQPPIGRLLTNYQAVLDAEHGPVRTVFALDDAVIGEARRLVVAVQAQPDDSVGLYQSRQGVSGYSWVQITDLALDVVVTADDLVLRTYDLTTGRARPHVAVRRNDGQSVVTDADGTARMARPTSGTSLSLTARDGDDVATVYDRADGPSGWLLEGSPVRGALFLVDDRGTYRPGETIHAAGFARVFADGSPRIPHRAPEGTEVSWQLFTLDGTVVQSGTTRTNARGVFSLTVPVPENCRLGDAHLIVSAADFGETRRNLVLDDVRTPTYTLNVTPNAPSVVMGSESRVTVNAQYYSGGALPHAPVSWSIKTRRAAFQPPGREDYHFGGWEPYGEPTGRELLERAADRPDLEGVTDAQGEHTLVVQWQSAPDGQAYEVHYQAEVGDVDNRVGLAEASQWVHPADVYVGLRTPPGFVEAGMPMSVWAVTCTPEGAPASGRIHVTVQRYAGDDADETSATVLVDTHLASDGARPLEVAFQPKQPGRYDVTAEVRDAIGRLSRTVTSVWVQGPSVRRSEGEASALTSDKTAYAPGDVAALLLEAPFSPAEGVLLVQQGTLLLKEAFHLSSPTTVLKVPITGEMTPMVKVMVVLTGEDGSSFSEGGRNQTTLETTLAVPPDRFALTCEVVPAAAKVRPGDETEIDVVVRDAQGVPVADADVVLIAVDAAVKDLNHLPDPDPLGTFYPASFEKLIYQGFRGNGTTAVLMESLAVYRYSTGETGSKRAPLLRRHFSPLAAFIVDGRTDGAGRFHAVVRMPDNLTRYRVTALAATDFRFGHGDAALEAGLPLMVRAATPRFLNTGDRFSLALVIQNTTDAAMTVDAAVRAEGLVLEGAAAQRVTVPAHDRVRVQFPARAGLPGKAVFQARVEADQAHDALELALPIYTPADPERFAQYGTVTEGAHGLPVALPDHVWSAFGGLSVTTSSTLLSGLTEAAAYVRDYPFLGTEQRASRILVLTALQALAGFDPAWAEAEVDARIREDLRFLSREQGNDGGFGPWGFGSESQPFLTVHAAYALHQAQAAGYAVPETLRSRLWGYLEALDARIPETYDARARASITAYAACVRRLTGRPVGDLTAVFQALPAGEHSPETLGWLLAASDGAAPADAVLRAIDNRIDVTAGSARLLGTPWSGGSATLFSGLRGQAVVLWALLRVQPDHPLLGKLTTGLMDGRRNGRWCSTQENAHALLAMAAYLQTYEAEVPNFQAGVWLGGRLMAEASFLDRETLQQTARIPMDQLAAFTPGALVIGKTGPGRLYYRAALSYAPADLHSKPLAAGFWVMRRYEGLEDPDDVRREADGTWYLREGARVAVITEVTTHGPRDNVALTVPLPAGLEAVPSSPRGRPPKGPRRRQGRGLVDEGMWGYVGVWQHQNLRAERAEAFGSRLSQGTHVFRFTARVVVSGDYLVPPARAEEQYHDETFGRTGTERVVVVPR